MSIQPYILGKGRAGLAAAKALAMVALTDQSSGLRPVVWLERGAGFPAVRHDGAASLLVVANPPGLHADAILEAERKGFAAVLVEKPVAVSLASVERLRAVQTKVAVFHGYRQTWGLQTLRRMIQDGQLGELIAIEGRYWQASTAERAINPGAAALSWKNDPSLSGPSDALLDVGSHWVDAAAFLAGERPQRIEGWRSYINAEAPHRDTHVHLSLVFPGGPRGLGSISKTVHGATNHFEIVVLGARGSASWTFLRPDEIFVGEGRDRRVVTRRTAELGSQQPTFHGTGWLEGYMEIVRQMLNDLAGRPASYPTLGESLDNLEAMLRADWRS